MGLWVRGDGGERRVYLECILKTDDIFRLAGVAVLCLVLAIGGGGCASSSMKGTPFYTGEYSVRQGPDEDRVNLWPLIYYHNPSLSVLWPFIELTDEHLAVRPLMSIYDRDTDTPVYNVLWPVAKFNTKTHNHRIFPFYWGEDYFVGFPLYWHFDEPWSGSGYDGLFPLWSYSSYGKENYSTYIMWPFLHFKNRGDDQTGWRVWPLAGSYNDDGDRYRFAAWPLGHQWSSAGTSRKGSCFFPLYYHDNDSNDSIFLSLPYSRGKTDHASWETVLPIYHRRKTESGSNFYSLLYSMGEDSYTEEKWNLTIPLWYSKSSPDERLVATLLGGYKRHGDDKFWVALPAFSWGRKGGESSDVWIGGPLAHFGREGKNRESHIFPFYYRSQDEYGEHFYSLLWSSCKNSDGSKWQLLPPLMYRYQDDDSKTLITPLYAQGTSDGGETKWNSIVPLVFNRKTENEHLVATLLGGYSKSADSLSWLALPMLGGGRVTEDESSFWAAAPLIHGRWDGERSEHHVLPFYYWNGWSDTFMSLPISRWERDGKTTTMVPLALSWMTGSETRKDLWMMGPLAHFSWGDGASASHIFPLYYHNRETETSLSLPFCRWKDSDTENWLYPPLLSLYTKSDDTKNFYSLLGLFRQQWGGDSEGISRLWPLYDYHENSHFLSLLFGWNNDSDGFVYPLTPLVGIRRGDYRGGWLFPLWSRRRNLESGHVNGTFLWGGYWRKGERYRSGIFPFYGYDNFGNMPDEGISSDNYQRYGKSFWSLPICWYRNHMTVSPEKNDINRPGFKTKSKEHGIFPLWSYSRTTRINLNDNTVSKDAGRSLLLLLYDYKCEVREPKKDQDGYNYTRSRILWRLWHYERENGDVSVDIFPAITYDKKLNGFHKLSFVWRLFRYEDGPDGKKLDLLFVPIVR